LAQILPPRAAPKRNPGARKKSGEGKKDAENLEDFTFSLDAITDMPLWLRALDDGGISAMSGYILSEGEYRWFCNERWAQYFMDQKEAHHLIEENAVLPWYFMSG